LSGHFLCASDIISVYHEVRPGLITMNAKEWLLPQALVAQLVKQAVTIQGLSYSPYSNKSIGSAVFGLDKSGRAVMAAGTNVEFVSYGLTLCAESVALANAVTQGTRELIAVVCVGHSEKIQTVCGACRQRLAEFIVGAPAWLIATAKGGGPVQVFRIDQCWSDLIPYQMHSSNISRESNVIQALKGYYDEQADRV